MHGAQALVVVGGGGAALARAALVAQGVLEGEGAVGAERLFGEADRDGGALGEAGGPLAGGRQELIGFGEGVE